MSGAVQIVKGANHSNETYKWNNYATGEAKNEKGESCFVKKDINTYDCHYHDERCFCAQTRLCLR